ncbi:MAG: 50S ribosomal protein L15 [Actinomycetota bacterium]
MAWRNLMKVHDLKPAEGSRKRRKRVGRGIAGKGGKTAGRGTKGQKARNTIPIGFEGGQLPLQQRLPKLRGFNNPFRVDYQAINLDTIVESGLTEVTPEALLDKGLIGKGSLVKVLGRGEISEPVNVKAHAFSKSAEAAITAAGGSVEKLPLPFKVRPAAQGNALTNR